MTKTSIQKIILSRLLKKPAPERYSISLPASQQKSYDFLSVIGSTAEHEDAYILSWDKDNDVVSYMWWPEGAAGVRGNNASCKFADLKWETLNVRHRYRTWEISYNKLSEAFYHDLLHLPWFKWWLQKLRNKFLWPVSPDYRMTLLKQIVEMHSRQLSITAEDLLISIHGSTIRLSSDYYRHYKNLAFLLESLKNSGDVLLKDENNAIHFVGRGSIVPTPQAASTIATYNEDARRHRDIVKLSKRQLWLGWGMSAIAAVALFVELRKWLG